MTPDGKPDGRRLRFAHRRQELLDGATEYLLEHGVRDLALRPVAEALGISHASLLRHFKSKEDLLLEVLENIRASTATNLSLADESESVEDVAGAIWRELSQPRQQRQFLLLFELVDRRAWGEAANAGLVSSLVGSWVSLISDQLLAIGQSPVEAQAAATLFLAQVRGLQLDLLLTNERARIDRAFALALSDLTARTS